jgi:chromosome segregation ATPase
MNFKIAIVILIVIAAALGIALVATKEQATGQHQTDVTAIVDFSNQVVDANSQLKDLREVNISLTNDLAVSRAEAAQLSNNLASALATIAETRASLVGAEDQITNLNEHVSELDEHVAKLEDQNKQLGDQAAQLTNTISYLNNEIADTQAQLSQMTTNNTYLQGELQKQMAERADLEHKFNDITEVRAQVGKLKEEIFIARRLKFMKDDTNNKKGGEMLMTRAKPSKATTSTNASPNYDLNVEVGSDGSVKIIPPLGATNAPAGSK